MFDSDCTRSIDREDVSKRVKKIIIKGGRGGGGKEGRIGEKGLWKMVYICKQACLIIKLVGFFFFLMKQFLIYVIDIRIILFCDSKWIFKYRYDHFFFLC